MLKAMDEYYERFGNCFPLMLCRTVSEDGIVKIIRKCLDEGKEFEPDLEPDGYY